MNSCNNQAVRSVASRLAMVFWLIGFVASANANEPSVDFNSQIRSLLSDRCVFCHGPDEEERAAGLRLDTFAGATEDLGGYAAIIPHDADDSELILRITSDNEDLKMPPPGKGAPLSVAEVEVLRKWINEGAAYQTHWSYQLPTKEALPAIDLSDEQTQLRDNANEIDAFVWAKLHSLGMSPSRQADRLTLARRVSIDLTGLPPKWSDALAFANDQSANAYEAFVDQCLNSPRLGERWARVWLDLARYADSAGYADDPPRTIWPYRDYVIRSLNANKPFDQFTIEQIAGDLLENPTQEQLVATAFHRNTLTNNEGGTNDEEFRNVAVVDRVNTTMAVWMGTTMACAQCHTHKFDPITHEDYFKFFAFFNQTEDADRRDESPTIEVWEGSLRQQREELSRKVSDLRSQLDTETPELIEDRQSWLSRLTNPPTWQRTKIKTANADNRKLSIEESSLVVAGDVGDSSPDTDSYHITIGTDQPATTADENPQSGKADHQWSSITAIKLAIPKSQKGNFVLSRVSAFFEPTPRQESPASFLRITLPGKNRILQLAEVQAFVGQQNVASDGKAKQSSTYPGGDAANANDTRTDGDFKSGSVSHTKTQDSPWFEIEFSNARLVDRVVVWNRTDGGTANSKRLDGFQLELLDADRNLIWKTTAQSAPDSKAEYSVDHRIALSISDARSNHAQKGFPASAAIPSSVGGQSPSETGWAVAGHLGKQHELTLTFDKAVSLTHGDLHLELDQTSPHKRHLIDRLSVSATSNQQIQEWAGIPPKVHEAILTSPELRSDDQRRQLATYHRSLSPVLANQRSSLNALQKRKKELQPPTVPVMRERADDKLRETHIQIRGNYTSLGDKVTAGTPDAFHPLPDGEPVDRLALAQWLVDSKNPLTARVIVNRHWEQIFGAGLVPTSEEFGSQGEPPTHPKLLDWLAVDLQENEWNIKRLLKQIVMSATYRQSSIATPRQLAMDPTNTYLARGPRFRISAEMVRDQALFVGGLLSNKMYGPPVKPPQPSLGLKAAFGSATDWTTSEGDDRYRRGLYTTWRRSSPYPSMAAFDAPNREVCTVRRGRTNTPLQALVTLNDPVYIETAQSFARRLIDTSDIIEERIQIAFCDSLIRDATTEEVQRLVQLYQDALIHFKNRPDDATSMAEEPLGPLPDSADLGDYASMTVLCNIVLNLDEIFMKR